MTEYGGAELQDRIRTRGESGKVRALGLLYFVCWECRLPYAA
jgi:hypothetical protein